MCSFANHWTLPVNYVSRHAAASWAGGTWIILVRPYLSLSAPLTFSLIWEFFPDFPLVWSSWDGNALSIICSICSQNRLWGYGCYQQLPFLHALQETSSWSEQNKPSRVHSPWTELFQLCLTPQCAHTHLYTHLYTLTLFICHSTGPNITFHTPRSRILWCEAILKFLEALCWHRTSYYFPETQVTV